MYARNPPSSKTKKVINGTPIKRNHAIRTGAVKHKIFMRNMRNFMFYRIRSTALVNLKCQNQYPTQFRYHINLTCNISNHSENTCKKQPESTFIRWTIIAVFQRVFQLARGVLSLFAVYFDSQFSKNVNKKNID